MLGNVTTAMIFRIPRDLCMSGSQRKPTCGGCEINIPFPDYLPLYRYLFVSKTCRCGKYKIPPIYTIVELSNMMIGMLIFILWHSNIDFMITKAIISSFTIMNIAIYIQNKKTYPNALWILLSSGIFSLLYNNHNFDPINHCIGVYISTAALLLLSRKLKIAQLDFRFSLILLSIVNAKMIILLLPIFLLSFIFSYKYNKGSHFASCINGVWFLITTVILSKYVNV